MYQKECKATGSRTTGYHIEYSIEIRKGNSILEHQSIRYLNSTCKSEAIRNIDHQLTEILENKIIELGQISNYNRIFILLRHFNGDLWKILEYKPTFQYIWHEGYTAINSFCKMLGVTIEK